MGSLESVLPCLAQTLDEPLSIGHSRERPNQALIARCYPRHTIQQLIQRGARGCITPQMSIGRSQDRVNVGKHTICFTGEFSELNRLFVPPGQQRGPAFAEMPDDHQQASRAEANRFLQVLQGSVIIAAERITYAKIAAGELRIGIELKGMTEASPCLVVTA